MENVGIIARLSSETRLHHADADGDLERLLAEPTAQAYRAWLLRQHGFLAPLEAAVDGSPAVATLVDLRARRKVPRLRSDLLALGVPLAAIASAPLCGGIPRAFPRTPAALGWMYCVERSILQYSHAFRQLARVLPGEVAFASEYLKCYDGNAGVMWRAFASTIEQTCQRAEDMTELVAAAQESFRTMRRWHHQGSSAMVRVGFTTQRAR